MKRLGILLISLIIAFLLIEVFFRCFYPISQYSIMPASYGFKHIPNTTVTFYGEFAKWGWKQGGVEIKYNILGLQDIRGKTSSRLW